MKRLRPDRLGGARSILAVRLDTIGDVVMTTPSLGALGSHGARVTLLTSSVSRSLAPMLVGVDDVLTLDVPWMKPAESHLEPSAAHLDALSLIRTRAFDAAVIFTVSTQDPSCAAYLCYLAGIPRVAAYVSGKLYGLVSDPVADPDTWPPSRHEVLRQVELVESLGFDCADTELALDIPAPSRLVRELVAETGERWCVVHPGATAPSRRYPNELWARVIDRLQAKGVRAVLAGGKRDRERCADIVSRCAVSPIRADGRLALPELASLLALAPSAATCNSSAAHLCAAAGTPVTTLYAGTNPQHTPWSSNAVVLRNPTQCTWCLSSMCRHSSPTCIASIAPERVAHSVLTRIRHTGGENGAPAVARQRVGLTELGPDKRVPRHPNWRTGATPPA